MYKHKKIEPKDLGNRVREGLDTTMEKVTEKCSRKSQRELDYVSSHKLAPVKNP